MPDGAESIPVAGVSPDDPILQQLANGPAVCLFVARMGGHELRLSVCLSTLRLCGNMRRENSIISGLSLESRRRGFLAEVASGLDPIGGDPTEAPSAKVDGKQG